MGKGASITAGGGTPQFRTGHIKTPAKALVTERQSVVVRIGRDDAPLVAPQNVVASMATGTSIIGHQKKVTRDSLATERCKVTERDTLTLPERDADTGLLVQVRGTRVDGTRLKMTEVVRTLDMGDEALPRLVKAAPTRKAQPEDMPAIRQVAASIGLNADRLTPKQVRTIRAYIAEKVDQHSYGSR